jgi:hypothetical protein
MVDDRRCPVPSLRRADRVRSAVAAAVCLWSAWLIRRSKADDQSPAATLPPTGTLAEKCDQQDAIHTQRRNSGKTVRERDGCSIQRESKHGEEARECERTHDDPAQEAMGRRRTRSILGEHSHDTREDRKWRKQTTPSRSQHTGGARDREHHDGSNDHPEGKIPPWRASV